jgi:hypothetical protein
LAFLASVGVEPTRTDGVYLHSDGGTAKVQNRGLVLWVSFSGRLLAVLRASGAFRDLLGLLCTVSHRVTRLDASLDVLEDAPAHLVKVFRSARRGRVQLGQRPVPRSAIGRILRPAIYNLDTLTGSVYVGLRGDDRRLLVYDKRNERLDAGLEDPGPWTRYELTVGKGGRSGVSLRDAEDPTALFWSVLGSQVLPKPDGVPDWQPAGEGFTLPKPAAVSAVSRLNQAAEHSDALAGLVKLAASLGPATDPAQDEPGLVILLQAVRRAYRLAAASRDFGATACHTGA